MHWLMAALSLALAALLPIAFWIRLPLIVGAVAAAFAAGVRGAPVDPRPGPPPGGDEPAPPIDPGSVPTDRTLEAMERVAGGVAHDLNNVLTVINGHADLLLATLPAGDPARVDMEHIRRAGGRGADLAGQLLSLWKRSPPSVRSVDPSVVVRDAVPTLRALLGPRVALDLDLDGPVPAIQADPRGIEQILVNLVRNASEAMPETGRVRIRLARCEPPDAEAGAPGDLLIEISDTGRGMSPQVLDRASEPFFSTKEGGGGLGLSTVAGLVRRFGGDVGIESREGIGTVVSVRIPGSEAPVVETEPRRDPDEPMPVGETILVVEDEDVVRSLAERILRRRGYRVLSAASGREALEAVAGVEFPIDLVLSDVVMPGMSGPETVAQLSRRGHRFRVLYMSGYTDDHLGPYGVSRDRIDFLPKPFDPEGLVRRIREVLDAHPHGPG
jgi:two-component system, cell cycle sensor histidine kinase and response regulator CckA